MFGLPEEVCPPPFCPPLFCLVELKSNSPMSITTSFPLPLLPPVVPFWPCCALEPVELASCELPFKLPEVFSAIEAFDGREFVVLLFSVFLPLHAVKVKAAKAATPHSKAVRNINFFILLTRLNKFICRLRRSPQPGECLKHGNCRGQKHLLSFPCIRPAYW